MIERHECVVGAKRSKTIKSLVHRHKKRKFRACTNMTNLWFVNDRAEDTLSTLAVDTLAVDTLAVDTLAAAVGIHAAVDTLVAAVDTPAAVVVGTLAAVVVGTLAAAAVGTLAAAAAVGTLAAAAVVGSRLPVPCQKTWLSFVGFVWLE